MLKDIKSSAKHSIVYAFGNMGSKVVGFLLIPFYTNPDLLSTSDYGALAVLEATLQVLVGVLAFAMASSLSRWYWDKNHVKDQKSIFFTTLSFLSVVIIPTSLFLCLISDNLSLLLFKNVDFSLLVKLTILTSAVQIVNNLTLTLLKLKSQSVLFVVLQITKFVGFLLLVLFGLKYRGLGLLGVWEAYLLVEIIIFLVLIPIVIKNCKIKFHFQLLKEMLSYGMPLMLASLSGVILTVTDRYMLNSMKGLEKTAVYSVGYRIANTLKVVITSSLGVAIMPIKMKKMGEVGSEIFYAKVQKYSAFIFAIALLGLSLFALEILKIITGSAIYWQAHSIIAIVGFALLFGQLKNDALIGLTITKKTKITGILIFITSVINIGLNMLLIPLFDIYGAALATLISQLFFCAILYITVQKVYFIPYEMRNTFVMIVLLAIFIYVGIRVSDFGLLIRIIIKVTLLISYPFVLALFKYYDSNEKKNIKQLFDAWRKPAKLKENLKRFLR